MHLTRPIPRIRLSLCVLLYSLIRAMSPFQSHRIISPMPLNAEMRRRESSQTLQPFAPVLSKIASSSSGLMPRAVPSASIRSRGLASGERRANALSRLFLPIASFPCGGHRIVPFAILPRISITW